MTLVRSIHHLTRGRIMHVQAVLTYHVTLAVGLSRECHRALRTSEWLLTYSANKQPKYLHKKTSIHRHTKHNCHKWCKAFTTNTNHANI